MRRWMLALILISTVSAVGCGVTGGHNLPPASQLAHPGPGVGGPGPGVIPPPIPPYGGGAPGGYAVADPVGPMGGSPMMGGAPMGGSPMLAARPMPGPANGSMPTSGVTPASYVEDGSCLADGSGVAMGLAPQQVQVLFGKPDSMNVHWDVSGVGQFDSAPLTTPGRQNFQQGGIYRLKFTNIPGAGREGVELYPTLEIGPPARRTLAYLAHNAVPIQMTEEDFDQVLAGNFVTKVIYLPDPEFQGLAVADVATLVSTRLEPGLDPIEEASRKGAILAVLRVGNKDMEVPGVDMSNQIMPASFLNHVSSPSGGCESGACASGCCGGSCGLGGGMGLGCNTCQIGGHSPATMSLPPGGMPPGLAGAGQYGMPMSGTPIGLPGPPHIPLGVPAGLQKHVIRNKTKMHIPDPVCDVQVNVRQRPGQSYPHPVSRVNITEDTVHPTVKYSHHHFGTPSTGQIQYSCGHVGPCMPGMAGGFMNGNCPNCN